MARAHARMALFHIETCAFACPPRMQRRGRALARHGSSARARRGGPARRVGELFAAKMDTSPCGPGVQCEALPRTTQISGDPRRLGHPRPARLRGSSCVFTKLEVIVSAWLSPSNRRAHGLGFLIEHSARPVRLARLAHLASLARRFQTTTIGHPADPRDWARAKLVMAPMRAGGARRLCSMHRPRAGTFSSAASARRLGRPRRARVVKTTLARHTRVVKTWRGRVLG